MQAHDLLTEAAGIVAGARNATHGDKERSFAVIANLWTVYLSGRKNDGPVTPRDVAQLMVLLKVARSIQGSPSHDHFVDAAGYAAIAGELADCEPRPAIAPAEMDSTVVELFAEADRAKVEQLAAEYTEVLVAAPIGEMPDAYVRRPVDEVQSAPMQQQDEPQFPAAWERAYADHGADRRPVAGDARIAARSDRA